MQFLLEQNQRQCRKLFFACLLIALALAPVVLHFVDRSMSSLHPQQTNTPPPSDPNASIWDQRNR
jgi:hypothetical protein